MSSAGGTSSSARAAEAKRRARRVPEDQRKRGIQSCDLCRKVQRTTRTEYISVDDKSKLMRRARNVADAYQHQEKPTVARHV